MPSAMTQKEQTTLKITGLIGLCALSAMGMSQGALSPAIASFSSLFPEHIANIALINTMPNLLAIPASLLSGQLADRGKLSYKQLAMIAIVICSVAGLIPMFYCTNFAFILFARACFGVGMGLYQPVCTSIVLIMVPGDRARKYLSITAAFSSLGGVLFQMIGGFLCDIAVNLTFGAYGLAVVAAVLIFLFLPNPARQVKVHAQGNKEPMGILIIFYAVMNLLFSGVFFIMTNNMSTVVVGSGMGSAANAATALSLFTFGAFLGSLGSSYVYKVFRIFTLAFCCVIGAVGYVVMIVGTSLPFMYVGGILFGLGFGFWNPCLQTYAGRSVPISKTATALSLTMCFAGIGNFLSAYFVNALTAAFHATSDRFGFIVGAVMFAIMTIVLIVFGIWFTAKAKKEKSLR